MVSRNLPTGRRRGRPKKVVETVQYTTSSRDVKMKCTECKKISYIQTNNPELYTDELRKTWVCILCKCPK